MTNEDRVTQLELAVARLATLALPTIAPAEFGDQPGHELGEDSFKSASAERWDKVPSTLK